MAARSYFYLSDNPRVLIFSLHVTVLHLDHVCVIMKSMDGRNVHFTFSAHENIIIKN